MHYCGRSTLFFLALNGVMLLVVGCGSETNDKTNPPSSVTAESPKVTNSPAPENSTPKDPASTSAESTAPALPDSTNKTETEAASTPASSPPKPLLKDWPAPKLAMLITGEIHGYFEPCGCTENQSGGMSRRADLIEKMQEMGWTVTGLDLGGTLKRNRRQDQLKYETVLASLTEMRYSVVGIGPEELRFGPDAFLQLHNPAPENPDTTPSLVSANIIMLETPDLGKFPSKVVTLNGVKLGVTSILGKDQRDQVIGATTSGDLKIEEAQAALPAVIASLKEQNPDLLVLLSHASKDESKALAEKFPEFDLIVTAGGAEEPNGVPQKVGKTMIVDVGHKGKHAGVVGYYPDQGDDKFRFELVELDRRFADNQKMIEQMRFYQERLRLEKLAYSEPALPHESGARFVGAEKCGECHTKAYEKWKTTKHAQATDSITHSRKGQPEYGITRIYDPECLCCHSTGWNPQEVIRYEGGFVNEEFAQSDEEKSLAKLLQGQQCENCHGPGSKHIELAEAGDIDGAKKLTHLDIATAKENVCYKCHDFDNSPHFEFKKYWKEIAHPWRD
ncbi:MAG: multiheme c-type cytochrome [Planctomycetaceae bacterium]